MFVRPETRLLEENTGNTRDKTYNMTNVINVAI